VAATWDKLDAVSVRSTQIATEAAPTLSDDGMPINGVRAVTFWLDAGVGQTLTSDAGQVDVYVYDADLWGVAPALVLQVPPRELRATPRAAWHGLDRQPAWTPRGDCQRGSP
jgi:hypothetical protein